MNKHRVGLHIEKNTFVDEGEGVIRFPNGLPITDDSVQKNGTRYDIDSMILDEYKGQITADHEDRLQSLIGSVTGVYKQGKQVVIDGIRFAVKSNALAKLAYDLILDNHLRDFSIETYGPPPDEEGVYKNAKLIGLSAVVVGNNNNATIRQSVLNSLAQAKEEGLDTTELEKLSSELDPVDKSKETNMSEVVKPAEAQEPKPEVAEQAAAPAPAPEAKPEVDQLSEIRNMLSEAIKPLAEKVEKIEQSAFDASAQEPQFKPAEKGAPVAKNEFAAMDWQERTAKQVNAGWDLLKARSFEAGETLRQINEFNLEQLKKDGVVRNAMTIADFGNFVISRELLSEIQGCRTDYSPLVDATNWRETLSTQMAWLNRSGDINMQSVEFCDDDADGNLKPISEYGATIRTSDLEELAAVTPVCNAATRFLAADMLGDIAAGYRNDYDRKRAQLVIARLEQAVEANGNSVIYDVNPAVESLKSFLGVWSEVANCTPNGVYIMSQASYAEMVGQALGVGVSGPLAQLFTTGNQPQIFGKNYIIVSNDLLPKLNSAETRSFVVNGVTVTVNHAVFYVNPSNFTGRISGGLQYDLSTEAAYEDGATVKSAYQRNELVLRGSFFRGGAILDNDQVAGLLSPGVS